MTSRPGPSLRQRQQEATRQRLLGAARECFITEGFIETTVGRIVASAGTSRATFYLYFRGKSDAMIATWGERELPEMEIRLRAYDEAGEFGLQATRIWMDDLIAYLEKNDGIMRSAVQAMALEPEIATKWMTGMMSASSDMPNYVRALGGGGQADDALLMRVVQLERAFHFWSEKVMPLSRDRLVDALAHVWRVAS
jgi:AcrR family transcriptional regulator